MTKKELAVQYKRSGFNCSQAVIAAYADELGLDIETAKKLGAAFGAGMGGMRGNCGALCGAQTVLGLIDKGGKPVIVKARNLYDGFVEMCGSAICSDLKGITNFDTFLPCDQCVANAVELLEQIRE